MTAESGNVGASALVAYSSRYGNTEKIARSLESGLKEAGFATVLLDTHDLHIDTLGRFDLLCIGGPTEWTSASKPMKEFLRSTKGMRLEGKMGFAFDTKLNGRFSGSAAKYIERALQDLGLRIVAPHESAIVSNRTGGKNGVGAILIDGEEKRFEEIGLRIGRLASETKASLMPGQGRQA